MSEPDDMERFPCQGCGRLPIEGEQWEYATICPICDGVVVA